MPVMHQRAVIGRVGRFVERLQRGQLQHVARIDRVGIAQPGLDLGHAEPARTQRHRRAGPRRARPGAAGPRAGPGRAPRRPPDAPAVVWPWPARNISNRVSQRAGTAGRRRAAPDRTARHAARAWPPTTKSCAACPTVSSGEARPTLARIGRDSHGPGSVAAGQTPSTSPPSTSMSDGLQPRLQQAPDEHARMFGPAAPAQRPAAAHDLALQHRVQQARQHRRARWSGSSGSAAWISARAWSASASPSSPAQSRAGPGRCRRWRPGARRPRSARPGPRPARPRSPRRCAAPVPGRLPAGAAGPRPSGAGGGPVERQPQPGQATQRARAAQAGLLQCPGGGAAGGGRQTGGGQRVFQQSEQAGPAPVPRRRRGSAGAGTRPAGSRRGVRRRCHRPPRRGAAARPRPGRPARDPGSPARRARPASPARRAAPGRWRRPPPAGRPASRRRQPASEGGRSAPASRAAPRPAAARGQRREPVRRHRRSRLHRPGPHVAARRTQAAQQAAQAGLRMRRRPAGSRRPRPSPVSSGGSTTGPLGSRATTRSKRATAGMPAGGAGDQHRLVRRLALPGGGLRIQQRHLPRGRVHQAVARPASAGQAAVTMCRNSSVRAQCAAYAGSAASGSRSARSISGPLRLVHQRRQFAGQQPGAVGGARRAVRARAWPGSAGTAPPAAAPARPPAAGRGRRPAPAAPRPARPAR